ncbi:MAG: S8 family serine peptidase [Actinomycetota bacterium]|nr:S8 family serine peptidase [Actinomycetota bacterium]
MSRTLWIALAVALLAAAPASGAQRIVQFDPGKTSRAQLRAGLDRLGLKSATLRKLPFAIAVGDTSALRRARRLDGVVRTSRNERLRFELDRSANLVFGGETRRTAAYAAGFDGSGVNVAVIDSGVDGLHPDLRDRVVRNVKVVGVDGLVDGAPGVFHHFVECPVACNTDTSSGHGTHVASIAAGTGTASAGAYRGVAPGAGIVSLGVGDAVAIFHALQAYDYLLAHPGLRVAAVNNSYGPTGGGRFDARSPIAIGTKALHAAGIAVVFSGGNSGVGANDGSDPQEPEGSSNCSPDAPEGMPGIEGSPCKSNPNGLAPWAISVGAVRKDHEGTIADQPLTFFSARGDDDPQRSMDGGYVIRYEPTLVAPGANIRAARTVTGAVVGTACVQQDPAACQTDKPQYEPFYAPSSGTSMAAPHVTGAIAVIQDAAEARLTRRLSPDEVKALLARTATRLTKYDALWDFPCGDLFPCGSDLGGTTMKGYERWQVGAGALNLGAALDTVAKAPPGTKDIAKKLPLPALAP